MRGMEEGFMINLGFGAFLDIGGFQAGNPEDTLCPS
jgi:hypothetical protein